MYHKRVLINLFIRDVNVLFKKKIYIYKIFFFLHFFILEQYNTLSFKSLRSANCFRFGEIHVFISVRMH